MELTRRQKNDFFEEIREQGLDPAGFDLSQEGEAIYIRHRETGEYFRVQSSDRETPIPGWRANDAYRILVDDLPWDFLVDHFRGWVSTVKRELDTPDLWQELRKGNRFLHDAVSDNLANTPFSPAEQIHISNQLEEIRAYILESRTLSIEQTAILEARLDDVEEASHRLGRKDWILLFAGTMLTLVLSAAIPPDVLQQVFSMTLQGLGHFFLGGRPQLPPQT